MSLSKVYAIDCEFVQDCNNRNMLARVSVVDNSCNIILDDYVKPEKPISDYRSCVSGINPGYEREAIAFDTVKSKILRLLKDGRVTLVGYDIHKDLDVLKISQHDVYNVVDLRTLHRLRAKYGNVPCLKDLASRELGMTIQNGPHSSVEVAKASMKIYQKFA